MAVVKNLMVRVGADFSGMRKGMQGASQSLDRFKRQTERTTSSVAGRNGIGGLSAEISGLGKTVSSSFSQIRGSKGIGGIAAGLRDLRPALGAASMGMRGLGGAAVGMGASLGGATLAVTALVAILAVATFGLYQASQAAVKFEADLGRVNMALKGNSKSYMEWARAQGLAKSTSVEMGATYGTLLGSFISDNQELANQTKQIVQTTRVVASATGRTIEDTLERMRSGLLGNTEAIEDLGIFVNVSMIESTKAFKEFANGKTWDQLDFRVQQQIRLAAILEQAYARYGDKLQNNVMNKQNMLMEQLKDIKLNLSQAFMPIWDAVLPALTELASSLAYVTEQIARFMYFVRGWDYDERTQGASEEAGAIKDQGEAYDDLAKSAKKAHKELASFDRLNLIGQKSGDGNGGSSGGSSGGAGSGGGWGTDPKDRPTLPVIPPEFLKKWRIEFDTPNPPDAGLGAVATAVVSTINAMAAEARLKIADLWSNLQLQNQLGLQGLNLQWANFANNLTTLTLPGLTANVLTQWANMWGNLGLQTQTGVVFQQGAWSGMWSNLGLQAQTGSLNLQTVWATMWQNLMIRSNTGTVNVLASWSSMLASKLAALTNVRPLIEGQWQLLMTKLESIKNPLTTVKENWQNTMTTLQNGVVATQLAVNMGFTQVGLSVLSLLSPLATVGETWAKGLQSLKEKTVTFLSPIIELITNVRNAWVNLMSSISGSKADGETSPSKGGVSWETIGVGAAATGGAAIASNWAKFSSSVSGFFSGAGKAISGGAGAVWGPVDTFLKHAWDRMQEYEREMGFGGSQVAFAKGGMVFGPTLAMVGDNPGARMDPEVIAPRSMFEEAIAGDNDRIVAMLQRVESAINGISKIEAVISRDAVGVASTEYINDEYRRGRNVLPNI